MDGAMLAPDEAPPVDAFFVTRAPGGEIWTRFEPPDTKHDIYIGDLDEAHLLEVTRSSAFYRRLPYLLSIVDVSRLRSMSAAARELGVGMNGGIKNRGFALVGASTTLRLFGGIVMRANALLHRYTADKTSKRVPQRQDSRSRP
jgi:hypothetical protein